LVLDTYEEAQSYLDHWLWRYLVEDTALASASVRIVVVGRKSLQADEGWRKLNQDRELLFETDLIRFDRGETAEYLKKIGFKNAEKPNDLNKIYKVTQGLPYYLNWVREQHEKGRTLDFSRGNQEIAELLFQRLDPQRRKILQVVACCRWFDSELIRHLLKQEKLGLSINTDEVENCLEWLKSSDFVELTKGHYRLDDVARDVFRKYYFYDDQNQFRKTNAILADYFYQKANECVDPQDLLPDCYEDEDWQRPMCESLYYGLFGKGKAGLRQYIDTFFISVYLQQTDIFLAPFSFIFPDINEQNENESLIPRETEKFLKKTKKALTIGWIFLSRLPKNYKIKFEGENIPSEEELEILSKQIEASNQAILQYAGELKDGLGKCLGLIYKSIRCNNVREALDSILQAKSQAEELPENYRPKFVCSLFVNIGELLSDFDKNQDSFECYKKAIKIDCNNYLAFEGMASSLHFLERYDEALENIKKAIDLNPNSTSAWDGQAILLINLRRYQESRESLKKAMELSPKNYYIQNTHALNLSFLQDFEKAIIIINQLINIEPNEVLFKANRGIILARAGRYDEALVDCEEAIKQNPKHESGYYAKACYYALKNDIDQVLENLKKAIDIEPNTSRSEARWNPDFDGIRDDERFRALVYPDS
jgi:tetratricopeptide (TPR) repeat protein